MTLAFKQYYQLCKPKVLFLMVTTSWVGMFVAPEPWPSFLKFFGISAGIFCIAGFGAVLNHFFEDFIDAKMRRTHNRPLVTKTLNHREVSLFAFLILCVGSSLLYIYANNLTLLLTLGGALGYACVYTLYLKHATSQNIVIGGLYGALPPLLGWTALSNHIAPHALLLPLIIFVWTPPHFWVLAIDRVSDYKAAGLPMLPVTHGVKFTACFVLLYNILLFPVCLIPYIVGMFSSFYAIVSMILNSLYFVYNVHVFNERQGSAMRSFKFSIVYLYILFIVMVIDRIAISL